MDDDEMDFQRDPEGALKRQAIRARAESRARNEAHWRKQDAAIGKILAFCLIIAGIGMLAAWLVQP